jgi:hypothetical protein
MREPYAVHKLSCRVGEQSRVCMRKLEDDVIPEVFWIIPILYQSDDGR